MFSYLLPGVIGWIQDGTGDYRITLLLSFVNILIVTFTYDLEKGRCLENRNWLFKTGVTEIIYRVNVHSRINISVTGGGFELVGLN